MASRKTSVWEKPLPSTIRGGRGLVSGPSTPSSSVGNTSTSQPPPTANSFPPIAAASSPSHLLPQPTETPSQNQPTVYTNNRRQAAHRLVSRIPLKTSPTPPVQSSMLNSPHQQSLSLQKSALSTPSMRSSSSLSLSTAKPLSMAKTSSTAKLSSPTQSMPTSPSSSKANSLSTKSSSMGKLLSSAQALPTSRSSPTATSSSGNAWTTVRSKRQISILPSSFSNINRSSDSMPTAVANIPQDSVTISYEYNCGLTVVVPRHLPQNEVIDITVKEDVDPEDAVIEVSPAPSANSATNVHVQTTWKAVEDKMMEKVMDEIKNMEKRLKRQFKKDIQLFVDGALLIAMRNVEDMTVRKMMEVAQIPETASFGTVVEEFTEKFKCALTKDELQNLKSSSGRSNANAFAHLDPASRESNEYVTGLIEYLSDHGRKEEETRYRHYIDFAFNKMPIVRR